MRVIVIEPTKSPRVQEVEGVATALRSLISGWLEGFALKAKDQDLIAVYINEDGKRLRLTPNAIATQVCVRYGRSLLPDDMIVGTMVITGLTEDGEEIDVPQFYIDEILNFKL